MALTSDLKAQTAESIFCPDVVVTCYPQKNDDLDCREPKLIIEVLPTSTSSRDRTNKRLAYQRIDSQKVKWSSDAWICRCPSMKFTRARIGN